jgi:hypothetical protein
MRCAVEDWDNGKGIDESGDKLTFNHFNHFANLLGIKQDRAEEQEGRNSRDG